MSRLTNPEIDSIELGLGLALPGLYRKLLCEIGYGDISSSAEIYHPSALRDLYAPFFDEPGELFNPYFPFGSNRRKQEMWIIDASAERAASIWHETVPDDWHDEDWLTYEEWIKRHLAPEFPRQCLGSQTSIVRRCAADEITR